MAIRWYEMGDFNIQLDFSQAPGYENPQVIYKIFDQVRRDRRTTSWQLIPSYTTLTISYPWNQSLQDVLEILQQYLEISGLSDRGVKRYHIPVCYDEEFGPDLAYVANFHHLSIEEVIELHTHPDYRIEAVGFSPGFPYLSGLSPQLITPRRQTPRPKVPAGSVAIGGRQTGIYPVTTPGGWHLIGRTPLTLFRPHNNPPIVYHPGDLLHFFPISRAEYDQFAANPEQSMSVEWVT
ncbi:5-oxoprolinase subunit PxpB [Sulfobacillus thermosulfidooxidans]|uniref:5-oxoprolinase subunit PxpB n=1 Tax=Sulfobacillus thermosulfidooxidans TaxID=28034 RepID=UPI0009FA2F18|nr:5-oxoprolinase subunit PxpB [Sulfobacillus thermosulfidooxidans]